MDLPLYQVDAFADRAFGGNPAAVCPLGAWLPDDLMQAIAAENNLSETAFVVPAGAGFAVRWFTPTVEVALCGHATLAAAFVIATRLEPGRTRMVFETRSAGSLVVTREGELFVLDFPSSPATPAPAPAGLAAALGGPPPQEVLAGAFLMAVFGDGAEIRALGPDMAALSGLSHPVIVTAPGDEPGVDFVSRMFAPGIGIPEDPVTGAAHCMLAPYWVDRLGEDRLEARQVSRRGGHLTCTVRGDRVLIAGRARLFLEGTIRL